MSRLEKLTNAAKRLVQGIQDISDLAVGARNYSGAKLTPECADSLYWAFCRDKKTFEAQALSEYGTNNDSYMGGSSVGSDSYLLSGDAQFSIDLPTEAQVRVINRLKRRYESSIKRLSKMMRDSTDESIQSVVKMDTTMMRYSLFLSTVTDNKVLDRKLAATEDLTKEFDQQLNPGPDEFSPYAAQVMAEVERAGPGNTTYH